MAAAMKELRVGDLLGAIEQMMKPEHVARGGATEATLWVDVSYDRDGRLQRMDMDVSFPTTDGMSEPIGHIELLEGNRVHMYRTELE